MKHTISYAKKIIPVLCATVLSALSFPAQGQHHTGTFPYFRSFLDSDLDGISFLGIPTNSLQANNVATLTLDGLRLTNGKAEVGAFYLSDHAFSMEEGVTIEFEYMMYPTGVDGVTDGITMFLVENKAEYVDGPSNKMKFGAHGAGFGYTHRWSKGKDWSQGGYDRSNYQISGIKGAYLAVALDNGPFKVMRCEGEEQRNGIAYGPYYGATTVSTQNSAYDTGSNVTIRGAAGRGSKYLGGNDYYNGDTPEGFWGYPVLVSRFTGGASDPTNLRAVANTALDPVSGEFVSYPAPDIATPFRISSNGTFRSDAEANYRKATIILEPDNGVGGGFMITVKIQHGQDETTVIQDFTYPTTLKYMENACVQSGNTPYAAPTVYKYDLIVDRPDEVVIGFAASSGTVTAYTNVIKNLHIRVTRSATAVDDDIIEHRRGPVIVRPLDNDRAYVGDGTAGNPIFESPDNVDPASFRFWADENATAPLATFEHTVPQGKWRYDPVTAEVYFFPVKGYSGTVSILYDIKGKTDPYSREDYRSSRAKITVKIDDNQPAP